VSQRTPIRRCGKPYASEEEARCSKRALTGAAVPVPCPLRCGYWHLETVRDDADAGPDQATRELVYERDNWACVCCGQPVRGRPHSVGHRMRRSQGGSNLPSNLLTFLGWGNGFTDEDHHARIDQRKDEHDEARGYTVRSWHDPALVPVMVFSPGGSGVLAWPTDDGRWATEAPAREAS